MVEAATGAGTGALKIMGFLDTSMIERGFTRIKQSFESVKGRAKSFLADQHRMITASKNLTKGLIGIGVAGAAAMIALAKGAPAVAPAMAQIQVAMLKLQFAAGEALVPAFEKVADWLDKFASWTSQNPKIFSGLVIAFSTLSILKFTGVGGFLYSLATTVVGASVLTALGLLATIAAAGFVASKVLEGPAEGVKAFVQERIGREVPFEMLIEPFRRLFDIVPTGYLKKPGDSEEDRRLVTLQQEGAVWR